MKTIKIIFFVLFSSTFFLTESCKKYEDGPLLNIYSKRSRVEGNWDVESFTVNGADSTEVLKSKTYYGRYEFSKEKEGKYMMAFYHARYSSSYFKTGHWEFKNDKNDLLIVFNDLSGVAVHSMGPYGADNVTWEIRRLKTTQLWMRTTYNGIEYYLKLKHIQ